MLTQTSDTIIAVMLLVSFWSSRALYALTDTTFSAASTASSTPRFILSFNSFDTFCLNLSYLF